eukprot:4575033-Ditylum_brightwellii.AAC.1
MGEKYIDLDESLHHSPKGSVLLYELKFLYCLTSLAHARKTKEGIWEKRGHESMERVKKLAKDYP